MVFKDGRDNEPHPLAHEFVVYVNCAQITILECNYVRAAKEKEVRHDAIVFTDMGLAATLLLAGSIGARAQEISSVRDCAVDLKSVCAGVGPGAEAIQACMQKHMSELSVGCSSRLSKMLWVGNECSSDIQKFCPHAKYGSIGDCMRPHLSEVGDTCKAALAFIVSPAGAE